MLTHQRKNIPINFLHSWRIRGYSALLSLPCHATMPCRAPTCRAMTCHACRPACMHACMHSCTHACMHVCMHAERYLSSQEHHQWLLARPWVSLYQSSVPTSPLSASRICGCVCCVSHTRHKLCLRFRTISTRSVGCVAKQAQTACAAVSSSTLGLAGGLGPDLD